MEILKAILSNKANREKLIKEFQQQIWNGNEREENEIGEILSALAYDLDFYEPNQTLRKESPAYYGDERLEEEINLALEKIEQYKAAQ